MLAVNTAEVSLSVAIRPLIVSPLPANGPDELRQSTYYIDYQGVRFIAVSANVLPKGGEDSAKEIAGKRQLAWLEKVLRENPNRWTVVIEHQPVYPVSKDRNAPALQKTLAPLYEKYGVDLVLQGHDHAYGRSFKLRSGRPVSSAESGTVYVVSVSGSQMYRLTPGQQSLMAKTQADAQMFQVLHVDAARILFEATQLMESRSIASNYGNREDRRNQDRSTAADSVPSARRRLLKRVCGTCPRLVRLSNLPPTSNARLSDSMPHQS
jgi:hypothetical protein